MKRWGVGGSKWFPDSAFNKCLLGPNHVSGTVPKLEKEPGKNDDVTDTKGGNISKNKVVSCVTIKLGLKSIIGVSILGGHCWLINY